VIRAAAGQHGLAATGHVPTWAERLDPSVRDAFERRDDRRLAPVSSAGRT
jgi:hypothetical protein